MKLFLLFSLFFFLAPCSYAGADDNSSPAAELNAAYKKVRDLVADEKGRVPDETINNELKSIIMPLFDFDELTRRSVGAYWSRGTPAEQRELIDNLGDMLARTYLKRITHGVELIEVQEVTEKVEGDRATVAAKVEAKGVIVSTQARMHQTPGGWKIFDVAVEGIGLVANYRNEFPGIVRREGFRGLIDRLKKKHDNNGLRIAPASGL